MAHDVRIHQELEKAQHVRRYSIQTTSRGWEVKQEQDSQVVRQTCYQDWHRVERARRAFVIEMINLRQEGWQDVQEPGRRAGTGNRAWAQELRLLHEPIAQADDGFDLAARGAELAAKPPDVHVDRSRFDQAVVTPHPFQQPVSREHAIAVLYEVAEQFEFAPSQSNGLAIDLDADRVEVGDQVRAAIDCRRWRRLALATAQHGTDPRGELAKAERLADVIVCAGVEPTTRSLSVVRAVSMMIGTDLVAGRERSSRHTSRPFNTGRLRSSRIRSGGCSAAALSAASPLPTTCTSMSPPRSNVCLMSPAMSCSSSTASTRVLRCDATAGRPVAAGHRHVLGGSVKRILCHRFRENHGIGDRFLTGDECVNSA